MIFAIKPFEIHDGDGIRTTVFFKGCPLRCKWCHNPESFVPQKDLFYDSDQCIHCMRCTNLCHANKAVSYTHVFSRELCNLCGDCTKVCPKKAFEIVGTKKSAEEIAEEVLRDEMFIKGSGGGVTFSGGEPLMQIDLCVALASALKQRNINIAIDTCGAVPRSAIDRILPFADTFLFDVKAIDENVHIACTGVSNAQILENIQYVDRTGTPIEIRYPFVPTMNDGEIERIAEFVKKLNHVKSIRILGYHDFAQSKYNRLGLSYSLSHVAPPTKEEVRAVAEKMQRLGLTNATVF